MNHKIEILICYFAYYFCKVATVMIEFILDVMGFMINIMDKFSKK